MKLAAKDRKILIIGTGVVLALLSLAAFIQPEDDLEEDHPSSYSVKSGGAKATYLLLQELGYKVDRWTQPPQELPNVADGTLLMLTSPEWVRDSSPTKEAIRKFLAAGGTVLATGYSSGWLIPDSGAMPAWGNQFKRSWDTYSAVAPTDITRSAPEITMPSRGQWYDLPAGAVPLYGNEKTVVALQYPYGRGRVIWLASAAPISNAGLRIDANVRFLAAVLGSVHPQRIFWWEYAGEAGPSSNYGGPVTWAVTAQLGLLFLFALWSFARRSARSVLPSLCRACRPLNLWKHSPGCIEDVARVRPSWPLPTASSVPPRIASSGPRRRQNLPLLPAPSRSVPAETKPRFSARSRNSNPRCISRI
jgi:hypothetical protein